MKRLHHILGIACCALALVLTGCTSMKAPATTNIAVSKNAIDNADSAEAGKYAPAEISSARDNLGKANKAMSDEKYQEANDFAIKAQSDAKVATSKANATKAQAAADALNSGNRVLQDELNRKSSQ